MQKALNEYELSVAKLKRALKEQKISYKELAAGIGLSESGIKKILGAKDGSFQRLVQIASYAGLRLFDLIEESDADVINVKFSEKQELFFLANPRAFEVFWRLVYERESLETIELQLGKKESFKILRQLDSLGLIQLLPEGRVRVPTIRPIRWSGNGPFVRKLYRDWSRKMVDELARPGLEPGSIFLFRYIKMMPETYEDFLRALRGIENEFMAKGIREMQAGKKELHHVRWMTAADRKSFVP